MSKLDLFKRIFQGAQPAPEGEPVAPPAPAERRNGPPRVNAREGLRVLIIDDSITIATVLGKMLRQNGYVTASATDAESGIEFARTEAPDLIYLDIVLPGMNGFDALRVLRRDPVTCETPIIMISGNVQATEQFYVKRIGADDFMKKPFGRGEVFGRIQQLVEAGRLPPRAAPAPELLSDDGSIAPADDDVTSDATGAATGPVAGIAAEAVDAVAGS